MVHEIKKRKFSVKFREFVSSPFFIPVLLLLFIVITLPIVYLVSSKPVDIRQRAATGPTATINATPPAGNVAPGQSFTVDLVIDGGGQIFNASQATVAVSSNLTVQSVNILPPASGGCNFTFANSDSAPSVSNLSFAGAILNGSSSTCTLYTVTLQANSVGTGSITITNGQVKSQVDNSEIFLSSQNAIYAISNTPPAPIAQSVMYLNPSSSSVSNGQNFSVDLKINTNGQSVNATETDIIFPSNLLSVVDVSSVNGDFATEAIKTVTNGKISVAYGSIAPKSGDLQVVKVNFQAINSGIADVTLENSSVVSSVSNTEVLKNTIGGVYTITGAGVTATTTPIPTATTAPQVPTATTAPQAPSATPTTAVQPTATPNPNAQLSVSISNTLTGTYTSTQTFMGTKSSNASSVFVNNSTSGVTYPSPTSWQVVIQLSSGQNTIAVFGQDTSGNKSNTVTTNMRLHRLADINGDDLIDLTDLSMFGTDWEKTGNFNHLLSDMNPDGVINLTDFSVFAKAYGN